MFIADFHIHSRYSRATSKDCSPETLDLWGRRKGLNVIGTGDFTHAAWRAELREKLAPSGSSEGLYALKDEFRRAEPAPGERPLFLVSGEISSIYKRGGRVRKVHSLILLPSLEKADELSAKLERIGNLHSDGRPILGLDSRDLLEITLETCEDAVFIPAHIWTPHFSLFGAYSGFDAIEECFGDLTGHIFALETGLSSDPPMNRRLSALDRFTLVSNSDAHSPANLAREANLFASGMSYPEIARALRDRESGGFAGTIEFFPEEGKYHYDGHRNCGIRMKPSETIEKGGFCPVCGKQVTTGVLHRTEELADRPEGFVLPGSPRFESLAPLAEVIHASTGFSAVSRKGRWLYDELLARVGPELHVLREAPLEDVARAAGELAAEGVRRLRAGRVSLEPGYDGEYGKVKIMDERERALFFGQMSMFPEALKSVGRAKAGPINKPARAAVIAAEAPAEGLNPEQERAAASGAEAVAVAAGPGTGKTKTLVSRVIHLADKLGAVPAEILAVTFTNKAAGELRGRLEKQFGARLAKKFRVGTFHSVCLRILRESGATEPAVIDEAGALELARGAITALGLDISGRDALAGISLIKNGAADFADVKIPRELFEEYQNGLSRLGLTDYDDILRNALALPFAGFSHILVDEFQDVSPVQYDLIRLWAGKAKSLFVIGDPDQAIYGFRGSDPRCFERFFSDYPGAERVSLTRNYRSTPEILKLAAGWSGSGTALVPNRAGGAQPRVVKAESPFSEAVFAAKEINRLVGGVDMLSGGEHAGEAGVSFGDIAVLCRTNRQTEALEQAFIREGIPCVVAGRGAFLSAPEAIRAAAFFRSGPGRYYKAAKPEKLLDAWIEENHPGGSPALEMLRSAASRHESMADFLNALAFGRESDVSRSAGGKKYRGEAVTLTTLHGAKGMEFPVVFICGVNGGLIPYRGRNGTGGLSEERRLFYVGLTRARDKLILLTYGVPSPFLAEFPENSAAFEEAPKLKAVFEQTSLI